MPEMKRVSGALAAGVILALSGCVLGGSDGGDTSGTTVAPASAAAQGKEVETPEAFSLTDAALWDGRPSLGGIWVAHAAVKDPERVVIRNLDNGKTITGALFRRERDFPGPSIQMSSDAAAALGVLAGQPAKVSIVALRKPEPAPAPTPEPTADLADGQIDQSTLDVTAQAAAAIDRAEGTIRPTARPKDAKVAAPAATAQAPAAPADAEPASAKTPVVENPAKTTPADADADQDAQDAPAQPAAKPEAKPETETTAPAATGAPLSGVLEQPYVQVGTFTSEDNAKRAALDLSKGGMSAVVRTTGTGTQTVWRVIVGPALTAEERDGLLKKLKAAGYPDAYPVGG